MNLRLSPKFRKRPSSTGFSGAQGSALLTLSALLILHICATSATLCGRRSLAQQQDQYGGQGQGQSQYRPQGQGRRFRPSSQPQGQQQYQPQGQQQYQPQGQQQYQPQAPTQAAATSPAAASSSSADILAIHNQYRAVHHTPALVWSSSLESSAQSWANQLASSCSFDHSNQQNVGENLAAGYSFWADAAADWYNEIQQYDYSRASYMPGTGHATQMLWVSTTQLGCAVVNTPSGCNLRIVYVCQYSPPGNMQGAYAQNVLPP